MREAAEAVVRDSLGVQAGERVLVVADTRTQAIGEALRDAAARAGAEAVLALMDPRERHAQEPPDAIAAALLACDVFIAPTTASLSHTKAARPRPRTAPRRDAPGVTEEMLARVMTADLQEVKRRSDAVARCSPTSDEAHVSCPRGTDFTLDLSGRAGHSDDGDLEPRARLREPALRRGLRRAAQRPRAARRLEPRRDRPRPRRPDRRGRPPRRGDRPRGRAAQDHARARRASSARTWPSSASAPTRRRR